MTMGTPARAGSWAVALAIGLGACGPDEPRPHVYFEDFETECDGAPCGWERSAGDADQATWIETIHPGEHALRFVGEVTVRGPAAPPMSRLATSGAIFATLVARCDVGSALAMDVVLNDATLGAVVARASIVAREEWDTVDVAMMTDGAFTSATVSAVVITKSGGGACEIGEIVIDG